MKKILKIIFLMLFVLGSMISIPSLSAFEWGFLMNQTLGVDGVAGGADNQDTKLSYSGALLPWFSIPLGSPGNPAGKLYFSAGVTALYPNNNSDMPVFFVPELLRTELAFRIGANSELKFGRMNYSDPLGLVVHGLFDGARFTFSLKNSTFSTGVWYTGFQYKKTANITMTESDSLSFHQAFDYAKFTDTYFAPRRLIAALDWNNPYAASWLRLKISLIGQYDFTRDDSYYHSQYLVIKAGIPAGNFNFDIGGCFELAEIPDELKISFAGDLGIGWVLPTPIRDKLQLTFRLTNGAIPDSPIAAFGPITTISQGDILQAKFSGLSMLRLDYTARLHDTFSFNIASSYFIASDYVTYEGYPQVSSGERDGYFLGNEFYGRLIWSPLSDLQFNLGGGIFLPSMGNTGSQSGALWRINLNVTLAIF